MRMGITEAKEKKFDELEMASLDVLLKVLNGDQDVDDEANLAMKALNTVAKNRQTLTARSGIEFAMANRSLNDAEMAAYVAATQPEIRKTLPSSSDAA